MRYTYHYGDQTYTVELERSADGTLTATIGERRYTVQAQPTPHGWSLMLDNTRQRVYTASSGNERFVQVEGSRYRLTIPDKRSARRKSSTGAGGAELTAQMPGRVREVNVAEGDSVEKGQTLLILEAMKMEIRITAPDAGQVKRVLVSTGDMVERGQLLVEME
jgi:biotin carboxyl carrier protein